MSCDIRMIFYVHSRGGRRDNKSDRWKSKLKAKPRAGVAMNTCYTYTRNLIPKMIADFHDLKPFVVLIKSHKFDQRNNGFQRREWCHNINCCCYCALLFLAIYIMAKRAAHANNKEACSISLVYSFSAGGAILYIKPTSNDGRIPS